MVRAIISGRLHNRLIVILGVIALVAIGIHSTLNLNVEAYPDPTPPLVEVNTQNPGARPEEMERGMLVTPTLTRYLMPVLYGDVPAPAGHDMRKHALIEGSHFTDELLHETGREDVRENG
jgi:hypothetical protein